MDMDSPVDGIPWIFRMISSPAKCHETAESRLHERAALSSRLHERAALSIVIRRHGIPYGRTLLRLARRREVEILLNDGRHKTIGQFAEEDIADVAPVTCRWKSERAMDRRMLIVDARPRLDPTMFMAVDESSVFRA